MRYVIILAIVALITSQIDLEARNHAPAHAPRDRNVPAEFQRQHPCPSTGSTSGACPGYVRDHFKPLCKGGPDSAGNMQWQSVEAAKAKDRWECKP